MIMTFCAFEFQTQEQPGGVTGKPRGAQILVPKVKAQRIRCHGGNPLSLVRQRCHQQIANHRIIAAPVAQTLAQPLFHCRGKRLSSCRPVFRATRRRQEQVPQHAHNVLDVIGTAQEPGDQTAAFVDGRVVDKIPRLVSQWNSAGEVKRYATQKFAVVGRWGCDDAGALPTSLDHSIDLGGDGRGIGVGRIRFGRHFWFRLGSCRCRGLIRRRGRLPRDDVVRRRLEHALDRVYLAPGHSAQPSSQRGDSFERRAVVVGPLRQSDQDPPGIGAADAFEHLHAAHGAK
jgi:hypothetical protein